VSLGLGSVIAATLEVAPWLITIGRHKGEVFLAVGSLLVLNYWLAIVRPRRMNCAPGDVCHVDSPAMRFNGVMYWLSVGIYTIALVFTYAALWWVRRQA
jgi:hypothetical protein